MFNYFSSADSVENYNVFKQCSVFLLQLLVRKNSFCETTAANSMKLKKPVF